MYNFARTMYIMRKLNEEQLAIYVQKGYITSAQRDQILKEPQVTI